MNELILDSLMQLFALIGVVTNKTAVNLNKSFFESFLHQYFSKQIIEEKLLYFSKITGELTIFTGKSYSLSQKIDALCNQLNNELHLKDKILIIIYLSEFIKHHKINLEIISDENVEVNFLLESVVSKLNLSMNEYYQINYFITDEIHKISEKENILHINSGILPIRSGFKEIIKKSLQGHFFIMAIRSCNLFIFRYKGNDPILMGNKMLFSDHVYVLEKGMVFKWGDTSSLYYNEIAAQFLSPENIIPFYFEVVDLNFKFPHSNNGIHGLNFLAYSGQMVGIMGGSGSGKSTLLNLLNGTIEPSKGELLINGYNVRKNKDLIIPLMGYIPQDDLLIEELTVYQNLYYCAKICYGNLTEHEIKEKTINLLIELNLIEYQHLKVGSSLDKYISGGQRKRLNIAFELIREPYILFVDEPTSGLSTADSEKMMDLLRQQTYKGKLLFVNIHQPSAEIFKQFDKLIVLDKEGYVAFTGNPVDAVVYFKKIMGFIDADEAECTKCGNISSEIILNILEYPRVDEKGQDMNQRKTMPLQWHQYYLNNKPEIIDVKNPVQKLPEIEFKIPTLWNQFITYSRRNIAVKLADRQYMLISLLIAPFLALILAYISKFVSVNEDGTRVYSFIENENIPAFLFMSVIVSLFIGLTISAEEIFKDKKILLREAFVNLSRFSYLNSKILIVFFLSAFQMLLYIIISNLILGIKGMTYSFWIVLFSLSCFANLAGLNISSCFKSVVTIYIIIPLILVPQILLSGAIIKFDKLHYSFTSDKYVPLVGDIMASRWAFEALLVYQFKENAYQKNFYDVEKKISESGFNSNYVIPHLENNIEKYLEQKRKNKPAVINVMLIDNELKRMIRDRNIKKTATLLSFPENYNDTVLIEILNLLDDIKHQNSRQLNRLMQEKDKLINELEKRLGKEYLVSLKTQNYNNRLSEFVLNSREMQRYCLANNQVVQLYEPVYQEPQSKSGRAQFYAPFKKIGNFQLDTLLFNMIILWLMTLVLYIALYYNWFFRLINWRGKI